MKSRRITLFALAGTFAAVAIALVSRTGSTSIITGTAFEIAHDRKSIARIRRQGTELHVDLFYFPSFESSFEAPQISKGKDGQTIVLLKSHSPGPFHRKSEQLTNLSFTIHANLVPKDDLVLFRSGDYDEVFVTEKAP